MSERDQSWFQTKTEVLSNTVQSFCVILMMIAIQLYSSPLAVIKENNALRIHLV